MRIAIDYPVLTVGVPHGARNPKLIWGRESLEMDAPEQSHPELLTAISCLRPDGNGERETVYRIGRNHFRAARPDIHARGNRDTLELYSDLPAFIQHLAFFEASKWKNANTAYNLKSQPTDFDRPATWDVIPQSIANLEPLREIAVKDEDHEVKLAFKRHLNDTLSNMIIVGGVLFSELCRTVLWRSLLREVEFRPNGNGP